LREDDRARIDRSTQHDRSSRFDPFGRRILGDYLSVRLSAVSPLGPASETWKIPVRFEKGALSDRTAYRRQRLSAKLLARR